MISIILVNYNGKQFTSNCIDSIQKNWNTEAYEIIVVDNNSTDASVEFLEKQFPATQICKLSSNKGFGCANNYGVIHSHGEYIFILNNDTIIEKDFSSEMITLLEEKESIGIIAPQLKNPNGTHQLSYGKFPSIINEYSTKKQQEQITKTNIFSNGFNGTTEWVTGAALFMKRSLFNAVGGFDEEYFMYFEDIDFCKRIVDMGHSIYYTPKLSLTHIGGGSHSKKINSMIQFQYRKSQIRYYRKHQNKQQQLLLNLYLFLKYSFKYVLKKNEEATVARKILSMLFTKIKK